MAQIWIGADRIWLNLRAAAASGSLADYAINYLIWLNCRAMVAADPILGHLAGELYEFSAQHFSRLYLTADTEGSFEAALSELSRIGFAPEVEQDLKAIRIGPDQLERVYAQAKRSEWIFELLA